MSESSGKVKYSEDEKILALVEKISAYIEQYHGGGVEIVDYKDRVLKVRLSGACEDCSLSETTLQGWVAGTIHQFYPDVKVIEERIEEE